MFDRNQLFHDCHLFFSEEGSAVMKLSPKAAIEACKLAISHLALVVRIEGGIWHAPGFESRIDCIWDGVDPPTTEQRALINNNEAVAFIEQEQARHSAFVLTTASLKGYGHNRWTGETEQ